jgi:hypothetical protein
LFRRIWCIACVDVSQTAVDTHARAVRKQYRLAVGLLGGRLGQRMHTTPSSIRLTLWF